MFNPSKCSGAASWRVAGFFLSAGSGYALWEAFGCAPLIVSGPILDVVSERVGAHAATLDRDEVVDGYRSAIEARAA
jgi:hypothetical protein